jgi:hypothetical protein
MKKQIAQFEIDVNSGVIPLSSASKMRLYCDAIGSVVIQEQFKQWGYGYADDVARSAVIRLAQDKSIARGSYGSGDDIDAELIGVFQVTLYEDREVLDVQEGLK